MKSTMQKAIKLIESLEESPKIHRASKSRLDEIRFYEGYTEPGYDDPDSGCVAVGDWNNAQIRSGSDVLGKYWEDADYTMKRIAKVFEERWGIELEFYDEWDGCEHCNKIYRTRPDSYQWKPSFAWLDECSPVCESCISENFAEEYLQSLEDSPDKAMTLDDIDPEDHGYIKLNNDSYENGFHSGQDDSPQEIAKSLRHRGAERFIFTLDENSQFTTTFSVWIHEDEKHLITGEPAGKQSPSPSEILQAQLKGI